MTQSDQNSLDGNWYFGMANQQYGPVTLQDLRQRLAVGQILLSDLVWHPTLPQWVAAGSLPYFQDVTPSLQYQSIYAMGPVYAGFWLRFAAYIIDYIVLYIPSLIVQLPFSYLVQARAQTIRPGQFPGPDFWGAMLLSWALALSIQWLYFALMESSAKQASLGKMACGIKVTDENGNRISFAHATGRFFGKIVSSLTLAIGYMMAGWTEKKQALHDIMAKTLVVKKQG